MSQGAIDDQVRNALTKLAHIHFTSTETARRRVIAMGEEPWRVHRAGAPSLDHLRRSTLLDRAALEARLGLSLTSPTLVAAWHPVTILRDTNAEADAFFAALAHAPGQIVFVYPNADAGGLALIDRARALAATRTHTHVFVNLDAVKYWSLLGQADVLVGNSSSGIMEAASFALPVVNVGMRQQGRERARNVMDVPAEASAIRAALDHALSLTFRAKPLRHDQSLRRRNRGSDHRPRAGLRSARPPAGQAAGAAAITCRIGAIGALMTPRIPLSAPDIGEAEIAAVTAVLRTPHLSQGPELAAFEAELAVYHGVDHAVAVSSGTAGLHLALLTLGIGEGDEVILPAFTFVAVVNAVLQVRAAPVLVEIDPVTLNLDPAAVEHSISPRTRAILVVHTFGIPAQMNALKDLARSPSSGSD